MTLKSYNKNIMILTVIVSVLLFALYWRILNPSLHLILSFLIGIVVSLSIICNNGYLQCKCVLYNIILVSLTLRLVYYFATKFSSIPFIDPIGEYVVLRIFANEQKIFVIKDLSIRIITWYSEWSLLHVFALIFSRVTNICLYNVVQISSVVLSFVIILLIYLIYNQFTKYIDKTEGEYALLIPVLATYLYSVSPETIFWTMQFVRQNIGLLMASGMIYLISKLIQQLELNRNIALNIIYTLQSTYLRLKSL